MDTVTTLHIHVMQRSNRLLIINECWIVGTVHCLFCWRISCNFEY